MKYIQREQLAWRPAGFTDQHGRFFKAAILNPGYVDFTDVSLALLARQPKYGVRYLDGYDGRRPLLCKGIRVAGNTADYQELGIHPADVDEFAGRVQAYYAGYCGHTLQAEFIGARPTPRPVSASEALAAVAFLATRDVEINANPYIPETS
jgi:hypothetical protein